jgi:hypothetical protein
VMDLECDVCGHGWAFHAREKQRGDCFAVLRYETFGFPPADPVFCGCDEKAPSITEAMK